MVFCFYKSYRNHMNILFENRLFVSSVCLILETGIKNKILRKKWAFLAVPVLILGIDFIKLAHK